MVLESYLSFWIGSKSGIVFHIAIGYLLFECRAVDTVLEGDLVIEPEGHLSVLLFDLAFVPFAIRVWFGVAANAFY